MAKSPNQFETEERHEYVAPELKAVADLVEQTLDSLKLTKGKREDGGLYHVYLPYEQFPKVTTAIWNLGEDNIGALQDVLSERYKAVGWDHLFFYLEKKGVFRYTLVGYHVYLDKKPYDHHYIPTGPIWG